MTTIITAASAAQFLSLIPRMLGYLPTQSVVLVPFDGSRSLGALRFDLPAASDSDEIDRIAATLIGMVCRLPEADGVAIVTYTDAAFAESGMPHRDLTTALQRRAEDCGIHVGDALCVGTDAWGSQFDPLCPEFGRPLDELDDEPAGAAHLSIADGDQAAGAQLPIVDVAEKERVAGALRALEDAVRLLCGPSAAGSGAGTLAVDETCGESEPGLGGSGPGLRGSGPGLGGSGSGIGLAEPGLGDPGSGLGGSGPGLGDSGQHPADEHRRVDPQALATVCTLDDLPTLFETALTWDAAELTPYDAAALIWCLSRPALRDIALVQWSGGMDSGDEALDAQLRWESGEEYPAHLAMRMWGDGERPDPERLEAALTLARRAAAAAPRALRPGPLATCGWLTWALGRSTHAERYAVAACEIEPEHGLAEIVRSFVHAGHLPDWAFRPR